MTTKSTATVSLFILVVILGGAAMLFRIAWFPGSQPNVLALHSVRLIPPEPPMTILISCERGNQSGWASYGPIDIPEGAIFVHCKPNEDLTYDVSSTEAEVADSSRRPEVAFVINASGEAREAVITRSSGSRSLDAKILTLVSQRHYKPTGCGSCRVAARVAVDLKRRCP